jgi:uncharacterized damage-inducible protein DinB
MTAGTPEVWLRGPVPGVPPLLQHVAHALLQAAEDVERVTDGLPEALLWTRPGGAASVGFHLQHLTGVVDRLFTYARGESLSEAQRQALAAEAPAAEARGTEARGTQAPAAEARHGEVAADLVSLVTAFRRQVEAAVDQLRRTDEAQLTESRGVGRAQLPSTVIGLLSHAAEHAQRHVGQLLVTVRVQRPAGGG